MKYLYISLLLILCSFLGFSQETTFNDSMVVITMHNGDMRIGNILSDDGREILFLSKDVGKIYLRKENVKSIVPYKSEDFQIVDTEAQVHLRPDIISQPMRYLLIRRKTTQWLTCMVLKYILPPRIDSLLV